MDKLKRYNSFVKECKNARVKACKLVKSKRHNILDLAIQYM